MQHVSPHMPWLPSSSLSRFIYYLAQTARRRRQQPSSRVSRFSPLGYTVARRRLAAWRDAYLNLHALTFTDCETS